MPQIEAGDRGDEPIGSSPTRALALRRSALPPARFCLSSRQRARLGSCAIATACKLRPSHAGLHSHYRAARQPDGDGSRRSTPPTSRDDNRWPRAATRERFTAHASHATLGAARAPRQPAAAKRSRVDSNAVEPTQRLATKPMRRAHRRPSPAPSACQHCHVRSPGRPVPATSRRHLQEELDQRKCLAAAAPRRTPRATMLVDARTMPNQDAQRLQRSTRMRADASITVVEEIPTRCCEVWCRYHSLL